MSARASRLDIRTMQQTKEAIENAASFLGITTSAFVVECARERAWILFDSLFANESNGSTRHKLFRSKVI